MGEPFILKSVFLLKPIRNVLERIIYKRQLPAVEGPGGLSESQFNFQKDRSTIHAINTVTKKAVKGMNKKYRVIIALDIRNETILWNPSGFSKFQTT